MVCKEPKESFLAQIKQVLEKGQVKSTRNQRACMRTLIKVDEATGVYQDCSKCKWVILVISAYPYGK
jgi:hypothetical protein